jgi:hypothetical protein
MLSLLLFGRMCAQFPIECSLPWMLVEHVLQSPDVGLLETVLMPFDLYNDAADYALRVLKQRFLYDEIEAEVSQMPTTILSSSTSTSSSSSSLNVFGDHFSFFWVTIFSDDHLQTKKNNSFLF